MGNTTTRQAIGARGERAAKRYLQSRGYTVLDEHITLRAGEIDLVVRSPEGMLVCVEVRTRTSNAFGTGIESLSWKKRRALRRSLLWVQSQSRWKGRWRVDLIAIDVQAGNSAARLMHMQNISL